MPARGIGSSKGTQVMVTVRSKSTRPAKATWTGPFVSWSEAELSLSRDYGEARSSVFGQESWLDRQRSFRDSIEQFGPDALLGPLKRGTTLPALVQGLSDARIVDLGGGSGWVFDALARAAAPPAEYVVLDRPEVCAYFNEIEAGARRFVPIPEWSELTGLDHPWTVLYCNSSLQYAASNEALLQILAGLNFQWVLLDDTLLTGADSDQFSIQWNSDRPTVARFLSLLRLVQDMLGVGARLVWRHPFAQPGYVNWAETTDASRLPRHPVTESLLFRVEAQTRIWRHLG